MLSRDQVLRIARLARIELAGPETEALEKSLNGILALVERMARVDTRGVEPMSHPEEAPLRLRDDAVTEPDGRAAFQDAAPQVEDGLYLVPRVVE
ncbi:MAG TPA: Asp-tRNA(Asn)/Glu-tRNA(Gln) amidotransferase subunit GatC [Usitatibacter sp.]|nr:Asp-tRNA(Asn)/Glu-tRNA(Gln) amidotransferase subunit GatC [Usitatibacter sp.]